MIASVLKSLEKPYIQGSVILNSFSLRSKRFRAVSEQRPREKWLPPLSFFASRFISRAAKTENLVPRSFFAPKQHGNACYAG